MKRPRLYQRKLRRHSHPRIPHVGHSAFRFAAPVVVCCNISLLGAREPVNGHRAPRPLPPYIHDFLPIRPFHTSRVRHGSAARFVHAAPTLPRWTSRGVGRRSPSVVFGLAYVGAYPWENMFFLFLVRYVGLFIAWERLTNGMQSDLFTVLPT